MLLGDESTQQKSGTVTSSSLRGLSSHTTLWFCNSVLQERPGKREQNYYEAHSEGFCLLFLHGSAAAGGKRPQGWCIPWAELQDVHIQGRVQAQQLLIERRKKKKKNNNIYRNC